jgi:putative endonuclease
MGSAAYILYSPGLDRYYIGHSADPEVRLVRDHNGGRNRSTKAGVPWRHCWARWFDTRAQAMAMERAIKARKSRAYIRDLIASGG